MSGKSSALDECLSILREVEACTKVLPGARVSFTTPACEELFDKFRECIVKLYIPSAAIEKAELAVKELESLLKDVVEGLGGRGWILPRETNDFSKSPLEHLKKKILLYTYDLLRGKLNLETYASKSRAAVNSSLRSNMRTMYEVWVLASILKHLLKYSARIAYPEHGFVHFDRHGKQKAGTMPPNLVLEIPGRGMLTFYLEVPRPLGWGDLKDLRRIWRLYISLRPDIMVYSGLVLDIVNLDSPDLPVLRPDLIIECKELEDWYVRARDLKGPANPALSFHEWFKRWLSGLWTGLADVLGVDSSIVKEVVEGKRRSVRVTEVQLVRLYKSIYRPEKFYLVSSPRLPPHVVGELESSGIVVFDGVRMGRTQTLEGLAEEVLKYAKPVHSKSGMVELSALKQKLLAYGLTASDMDIVHLALRFALNRAGEFVDFAKKDRRLTRAT